MANFDTFADIRADVRDRVGEDPNTPSPDYDATIERQIIRGYQDLANAHPFLWLRAAPPGVLRTVAPITTGTVQVTAESALVTFSAPPAVSVAGRKFQVAGLPEWYRIAVHTAGAATATLDAVYNAAGDPAAPYVVFQDEYDLASDVRHIVGMFVVEQGTPIRQKSEAWLWDHYSVPVGGWPPAYFARIGEARIRFSHYPTQAHRVEYPYTIVPADIDVAGTVPIRVPRNWRAALADAAVYWTMVVKNDTRADGAGQLYAGIREQVIADDQRKCSELDGFTAGRYPA